MWVCGVRVVNTEPSDRPMPFRVRHKDIMHARMQGMPRRKSRRQQARNEMCIMRATDEITAGWEQQFNVTGEIEQQHENVDAKLDEAQMDQQDGEVSTDKRGRSEIMQMEQPGLREEEAPRQRQHNCCNRTTWKETQRQRHWNG